MGSLASKRRATYQQIALPKAVEAVARSYGFDVPVFDLSELTDRNTVFNDDFYAKYVGNPDARDDDNDHWMKSVLWQRRAALWAALGEPDAKKYITPHAERGRDNLRTYADDLVACLEVIERTWVRPQWARLVSVSNPRPDAIARSSGNRLTIPVIYEMFFDKTEAEAAAKALQSEEAALRQLRVQARR